jgi:hypothetical protein
MSDVEMLLHSSGRLLHESVQEFRRFFCLVLSRHDDEDCHDWVRINAWYGHLLEKNYDFLVSSILVALSHR